ncbi:MAG TPA: choice-of-anchor D domain-containing protein [Solirubrobacterales bacterium]|nr:choice-of-anchor D domain-containing protein [Solirubrobacterales bacterium]
MFSLRSKPRPAGFASALTLFLAAVAMLVLPSAAVAAPEGGEEPSPPPLPQLTLEPGSYAFGLVEANRENRETTFELRNTGSVSAPVYGLEVTGPGSWNFSTGNTSCFLHALEPGESCYVQVSFHPQEVASFSVQLRAVTAGGISTTAELSGEGGRSQLGVATDPTNFGSVRVGSGGVIRTIDVTNKGNMPGGVFIAVIAGGAVGSFHLLDENCTGVLLSPRATCNLQVKFEPIGTGAKTARVLLVGDGDGGTQVTLTGIGLDPAPSAEPKPTVETGTTSTTRRKHRRSKPQRHRTLRRLRAAVADQRLPR